MRIRRVSSTKEFDSLVDDYITQGYRVKEQGESSAQLFKRKATAAGHVWTVILTVWWTWGIGNLIYHFAVGKDSVLVRIEPEIA